MHHFIWVYLDLFGFIWILGWLVLSLTLMATAATARFAVLATLTALLMTTRPAAFLREREHFDGFMVYIVWEEKKLH